MKLANADVNRTANKILDQRLKEEQIRISTLERIRSYGIDQWIDLIHADDLWIC